MAKGKGKRMSVFTREVTISTRQRIDLVDITAEVKKAVDESGIAEGIGLIYSIHTTTAVFVNENERSLLGDIESALEKIIPRGESYRHNRVDDNADAHLRAILVSNSLCVPISGGRPDLGTWQSVFLAELDGPRGRRVKVKVVGE